MLLADLYRFFLFFEDLVILVRSFYAFELTKNILITNHVKDV